MVQGKEFDKVLRAGRRKASFLGLKRRNNILLSLSELTALVRPTSESYIGARQIPVARIIGTEDRGTDFAVSFLPIRRNMERRWTKIRDLMLGPGISETVKVIEYGGFYFVRDGNHRVSVAKTHRIEFLDAEVTRYDVPAPLPPNMSRVKIPRFASKASFQKKTRFFDYVDAQRLGEARPETWQMLSDELLPRYRRRYEERMNRAADVGELERFFFDGELDPTMDIVESQALPTLFPGRYVLDIACELLNSYEDGYGELTPSEALVEYVRLRRRRRPVLRVVNNVVRRIRFMTSTAQQARDRFLRMTRLRRFYPEARIAEGRKDWYAFLTRQVVVTYSGYHAHETGRHALIDEVVRSWYEDLYSPAYRLFKEYQIQLPFPVVYMRWTRHHRRRILRSVRRSGYAPRHNLRRSLEAFLADNERIRHTRPEAV